MASCIELTVAIPTFNGNKTLSFAIESVLRQAITLVDREKIEIIVIDNGSTDGTSATCNTYKEKYGNLINIYRNDSNIGYDKNIDLIFSKARGNYVKILCDDDELLDGALIQFINAPRKFPTAKVFVANFIVYDSEMNNLIHKMDIGDGENRIYEETETFLEKSKGRYGQTSSLMFDRECWLNYPSDDGVGCLHMHAFKVLQLTHQFPGVVMPAPLIRCRSGSPNFHTTTISQVTAPLSGLKMLQKFNELHPRPIYDRLIYEQKKYIASIISNLRRQTSISSVLEAQLNTYAHLLHVPPVAKKRTLKSIIKKILRK
jgi:glycosyltransferase involved in cell wall biosynthesis